MNSYLLNPKDTLQSLFCSSFDTASSAFHEVFFLHLISWTFTSPFCLSDKFHRIFFTKYSSFLYFPLIFPRYSHPLIHFPQYTFAGDFKFTALKFFLCLDLNSSCILDLSPQKALKDVKLKMPQIHVISPQNLLLFFSLFSNTILFLITQGSMIYYQIPISTDLRYS